MAQSIFSEDSFDKWLAGHFKQSQSQIQILLRDPTALRFLVAWSLFESECLNSRAEPAKFEGFAETVINRAMFRRADFSEVGEHFHNRYQDGAVYRNLMHGHKIPELDQILKTSFANLDDKQLVLLLLFVIYRFRNNIFHGNKGVGSWLNYNEQIGLCIGIMQLFIDLAMALETESKRPEELA